jgi:hypothetical protein
MAGTKLVYELEKREISNSISRFSLYFGNMEARVYLLTNKDGMMPLNGLLPDKREFIGIRFYFCTIDKNRLSIN